MDFSSGNASANNSHSPSSTTTSTTSTSTLETTTHPALPCSPDLSQEPYFFLEQVGTVYVQTFICFVGIILFAITTAVFSQRKRFNSATYRFMTLLASMDLITMTLRLPQGLATCMEFNWCANKPYQMYLYIFSVYGEVPLTNMTENISAWLTMAIALERFLTMKDFTLSKSRCRPSQVWTYCSAIVMAAIFLNMPLFFLQNLGFEYDPELKRSFLVSNLTDFATSSYYEVYSWIRPVLVLLIPLIFLCNCNILLIVLVRVHRNRFNRNHTRQQQSSTISLQQARRSVAVASYTPQDLSNSPNLNKKDSTKVLKEPMNQHRVSWQITQTTQAEQIRNSAATLSNNRRQRSQTKLTILMIVIICLFIVGQIPQAFAYMKIYSLFGGEFDCFYNMFRMITQNLCLLCYCANFFVYLFLNRHFRQTLSMWSVSCFTTTIASCTTSSYRQHWRARMAAASVRDASVTEINTKTVNRPSLSRNRATNGVELRQTTPRTEHGRRLLQNDTNERQRLDSI